ncbi:hypothetical protein [Geobacter sp. SVR]|uniref:hypothetical protein n=1 Tax=Geobacter sp. SVR TaxID=2495594 RepID=UPI00143EFB8E|nr:hypothetical protein [Geobacter sp. SVR]BCS54261.1 hypothetical protein GSVR_25690 [Geobacter sp. SVR]GCF85881.1 hypothetical protein GSbR_24810 [Geobacter sp. SVR]
MPNHLLIYAIVIMNALCQLMLIWSLKALGKTRITFMALATALPLMSAVIMRGLVATGLIHGRLAEQSQLEHLLTQAMGILLIAGPWLVTAAAVLYRRNRKIRECSMA